MTLVSFALFMLSTFSCFLFIICGVLDNPGVTHSVPTSGYGMGHAWVTEGAFVDFSLFLTSNKEKQTQFACWRFNVGK